MEGQEWDKRYDPAQGWAYGEAPNDFLAEAAPKHIKSHSKLLALGEGEGRNAVFVAKEIEGSTIHCIDLSSVGLAKVPVLAQKKGIDPARLSTQVADLSDFDMGSQQWDGVFSIWCHLPSRLRREVHQKVLKGLKPGGAFILESYTPSNVGRGTGGPQKEDLCVTATQLKEDFGVADHALENAEVEIITLQEQEREVKEGQYHSGLSATVQMVLKKK